MQTLEDVRAEFDRLDGLLGIDTRPLKLSFSKRMSKQYGVCTFHGGRPDEIRLADFLQQDAAQLLETARHEYAHAAATLLTGRLHGHDAVWRAVCQKIGCSGSRLSKPCEAAENHLREREQSRAPRTYYLVECQSCHRVSRYQRRGKVVQALEHHPSGSCTCRFCGGRSFQLTTETERKER